MDTFERSGMRFDVRDHGPPDGEVVILLHGFPQNSSAWDGVAPKLAAAGYRTLAPDQRGYSPGARPAEHAAYQMRELVADVLALAEAAGARRFHVVGHDWGGAVAWAMAARLAGRLHTLTSVSTPHPKAFLDSMRRGQALKSAYMVFFQLPWLPERILLSGRPPRLYRSLRATGLSVEDARRYVDHLAQPGALHAALNWYRALARRPRRLGSAGDSAVPTMYVWGSADRFLGRVAAENTGRYVRGEYAFHELPGVSHWVPEQAPETLSLLILEHLGRHSAR